MNRVRISSTTVIQGVVLVFMLLWSAVAMAVSLRLATDDTPGNPWIMGGGSAFHNESPGIEIELYRIMADRLSLTLHLVRLPWKRCLNDLEHGRLDGIFPTSFKPERLSIGVYPTRNGKIDPSRESRESSYHLYCRATSPIDWDGQAFVNLSQMGRRTIGVPLAWSIATELRGMGIDLLEKPSPMELLVILEKGGLAGVVCLDTVIDTYIAQSPHRFTAIKKVFPPVAQKAYFLMLSNHFVGRYPHLSQKIWDTIAAIRTDPTFNAVMDRYMQ